jgi:hypothetical protein
MEDVTSWTLDEYLHIIGGEVNIEQTWQIVGDFCHPRPAWY